MSILSKVWGGVKKIVKGAARAIKKVAKKINSITPLGEQVWSLGTKVGKGVMKGIGKITKALGPVGTMALSFVLAPFLGPAISALWAGFGAGAAALATSANVLVSALGSAGTAIFNGVNFISGTLGAMGDAITKGASELIKGNFEGASKLFVDNLQSAFSGDAGFGGIQAGKDSFLADSSLLKTGGGNLGTPEIGLSDTPVTQTFSTSPDPGLVNSAGKPIDLDISGHISPQPTLGEALQTSATSANAAELGFTNLDTSGEIPTFTPDPQKETTLLEKSAKAASVASKLLDTGGAQSQLDLAGLEVGRKHHKVAEAGIAQPIVGFQGGNLFAQLLAQARGGFV